MAYPYYPTNSYFPATYQPVTYPAQQPAPQYSSGIMWVEDEREAAMYPLAPNNAVALWERSGKRAYMKKADATGKPTMTVYDLVERQEDVSAEDGKLPAYATKDELSAVVGALKGFDATVDNIKSEIESMKSDLYGVAGKRRKKQEAEDE